MPANNIEKDNIYIGAYLGYLENDKLRSISKVLPTVNIPFNLNLELMQRMLVMVITYLIIIFISITNIIYPCVQKFKFTKCIRLWWVIKFNNGKDSHG